MHVKLFLSGLEKKKMNISLPLGQVALKVCLLWASLAQSFFWAIFILHREITQFKTTEKILYM